MGVCRTRQGGQPFRGNRPRATRKNEKGCFYANFKPDKGNYTDDGNLITSRVGMYGANSNGLYDMAGNVAEWTSTVYTEAGVSMMNDLNPELTYNAAKEDPTCSSVKACAAVRGRTPSPLSVPPGEPMNSRTSPARTSVSAVYVRWLPHPINNPDKNTASCLK